MADQALRVFLCHSSQDKPSVRQLYHQLKAENVAPWLDEEDLVPGQDWDAEIRKAVRLCHIVIVCLSKHSINKAGYVHREIKFALDVADEQPEGTIFLIPLRLEECELPDRLRQRHLHWVNYFEESGFAKLMQALKMRAQSLSTEPLLLTPPTNEIATGSLKTLADKPEHLVPLATNPIQSPFTPRSRTILEPPSSPINYPHPPRPVPALPIHPTKRMVIPIVGLLLFIVGGSVFVYPYVNLVKFSPSVTAPIIVSPSIATAAAHAYTAGTRKSGVMLGLDAAHTHWNPYEKVLNATNVSHLTLLWSYITGNRITASPTIANGVVYIGSFDGRFYAFDASCLSACQPLWSYPTGNEIISSAAVANGIVYVGSKNDKFYAFDASCHHPCQPLWSYATGNEIVSSPIVANGIVYVGSKDDKFYAFDATCRSACQPLWSYATDDLIDSSPAVANGIVYIGSKDSKLYAFDATCRSTCQPLWSYATDDWIVSSPAIANGMVYVGSKDHKLYAFDATCRSACQPLWSYPTDDIIESDPAVANGIVYVGSQDNKLYAFNATCRSACRPLWVYPTDEAINSDPAVANGVVYVGSSNHKLHAFDATCRRACQRLWSYPTGDAINSDPAVANGMVYVGCDDGKFYAFGLI